MRDNEVAFDPNRKLVSIPKARELVGVSRRTIYNWMESGKVEYVRTAGGCVRIYLDTLWRSPHSPSNREGQTRREDGQWAPDSK